MTKRIAEHICGNCGRICKRDLDRKYCPVSAQNIFSNKNASSCIFYIPSNNEVNVGKKR